ncbi:MAG: type II toxin-antitoxin system Phd/YefM family antitoxin [Rickettsiales bacterium]|jgi:antitoxin StbD|nr:type II toxin-antitoxin system Phd/YefM family antitoxin [Rickettsiales bacterium]
MSSVVLSDLIASVSELKKHPMQVVSQAQGKPLAILNRNKPAFYCISPAMFEALIEKIEDEELIRLIQTRSGEQEIEVDINDL